MHDDMHATTLLSSELSTSIFLKIIRVYIHVQQYMYTVHTFISCIGYKGTSHKTGTATLNKVKQKLILQKSNKN